jgi:hypothetical protein
MVSTAANCQVGQPHRLITKLDRNIVLNTRIGISLDEMGLSDDEIKDLDPHLLAEAERRSEFPKEYDFTLYLALFRSWWHVRQALAKVVVSAFEDHEEDVPLWLILAWGLGENETEESIGTALTGVKYDEGVHLALQDNLAAWAYGTADEDEIRLMLTAGMPFQGAVRPCLAENEWTPQDILNEFVKDPELHHELLRNPALRPQMVRDIYAQIKDDEGGPKAMAYAGAELPADVIEALARRHYPEAWTPMGIAQQRNVTEQALLDLIGKCDDSWIRSSPAFTNNVRNKLRLTTGQRERAVASLKKTRSAIKSGRTGAITRRGGAEKALLDAVTANPKITLETVSRILVTADDEDF